MELLVKFSGPYIVYSRMRVNDADVFGDIIR